MDDLHGRRRFDGDQPYLQIPGMKPNHVASNLEIAKPDFIESLAKGMAVLEAFDTERQRINATMVADKTGITRAAARRHLLTLTSLGYLETDGSFFWLTPKVLRFSGGYLSSARLPRILQPTLNRLAVQIGEAISAVVLDGDEVVIVGRSGPTKMVAYGLHLGARLPAHATSTGRVLLASMNPRSFDDWLGHIELRKLTPKTVVDPCEFRKIIEDVRRSDFCVAAEEQELGVIAVAVPVRNLQGQAVAALNVVMQAAGGAPRERLRDLLLYLQDGAQELRGLM